MGEKLTAAVTVKLSDADMRLLQGLALRAGVGCSEFMRDLLHGAGESARADFEVLARMFGDAVPNDQVIHG